MCTALSFTTRDHYFGRNLDLDVSYGEEVVIMPRRFPFEFRHVKGSDVRYAMIGMATVVRGIPLCYDAVNEHGLSMAGLNFHGNAHYYRVADGKDNIAQFEVIPWILGKCRSVNEAEKALSRINITDTPFSNDIPPSPLHWMISDGERSLVVECMRDGMHIHENPVGVLTNNPPFEHQLENLEKYGHLRSDNAGILPDESLPYDAYCQGLGAVGLPGDVSSMSRFVRIAFFKKNSVCDADEMSSVGQFFHLLSSVEMPRGSCVTDHGTLDITGYSACMNCARGLYYYTTYTNRRINCIDMHGAELDDDTLSRFPLVSAESINRQN